PLSPFYSSSALFFQCHGPLLDLHSFPTRRSSDLFINSQSEALRCIRQYAIAGRECDRVWWSGVRACGRKICPLQRSSGQIFRPRSEEHTSELQSRVDLVCRLLLEKKNNTITSSTY